jgi:phosphate starvation-inducible PhoH-like protein
LNKHAHHSSLDLEPVDNQRLAMLCGPFNENLKHVENQLGVNIFNRGHHFQISGEPQPVATARKLLHHLYAQTQHEKPLSANQVHLSLQQAKNAPHHPHISSHKENSQQMENSITTQRGATVKPHSPNQELYIKNILSNDINFGVGPAGTGKTYLAVACAVSALEKELISRLLLVRPAVEAGEKLGFLPGDFAQKVDPYFRPLYDALYEMLGFDQVVKLIETHVIEVVPLAYMRGRTLNDAFIILDEAQNTTKEQMKMFLTRIGFNSKAVITGDITQTDLPKGSESGLNHTIEVLKNIKGISFTHFSGTDVVRHPLVQNILEAYETHERNKGK